MTGDPFYKPDIKPYIAYWQKEGMTEESRREDSWECGAARTIHAADHVVFPSEVEKAERRPDEHSDRPAHYRLSEKWVECMKAKGYRYVK